MKSPQILLTNDDGIQSPGLWAAAAALSELGFVHVVAPRDQFSGAGRGLPSNSDGVITRQEMQVNGKTWTVYSVGGSPAQTVLHGVLEILPERPDLAVSGINYGENMGIGITSSGTVGAALESASLGIPSMAVSLETDQAHHMSYSTEVDFSAAAHFTKLFAAQLLKRPHPLLPDIDLLKIDVPCDATPETAWQITRLSHQNYFISTAPQRTSWEEPKRLGYRVQWDQALDTPDTDVYTLLILRRVSVTPLSLDLTARVDREQIRRLLASE